MDFLFGLQKLQGNDEEDGPIRCLGCSESTILERIKILEMDAPREDCRANETPPDSLLQ